MLFVQVVTKNATLLSMQRKLGVSKTPDLRDGYPRDSANQLFASRKSRIELIDRAGQTDIWTGERQWLSRLMNCHQGRPS
jgi:hypothetical protein